MVVVLVLGGGFVYPAPPPLADDLPVPPKTEEVAGTLRPAPVTASSSVEQMICQYSWPCQRAVQVARCESTLNPRAYNSAGPFYGLYQVHYGSHAHRVGYSGPESLYDAQTNIRVAFQIWSERGWGAWPNC